MSAHVNFWHVTVDRILFLSRPKKYWSNKCSLVVVIYHASNKLIRKIEFTSEFLGFFSLFFKFLHRLFYVIQVKPNNFINL